MNELLKLEELEDQIYELYAELAYMRDQLQELTENTDAMLKELRLRKQELS